MTLIYWIFKHFLVQISFVVPPLVSSALGESSESILSDENFPDSCLPKSFQLSKVKYRTYHYTLRNSQKFAFAPPPMTPTMKINVGELEGEHKANIKTFLVAFSFYSLRSAKHS